MLYDENADIHVAIDGDIFIKCSDVREGFLILFICYYVFGFSYPNTVAKTLEFLQR